MKPQFLLSLCLLFIYGIGYSQDKGYIALSIGTSFLNMGTHLCLLTNLDYLGATPEFLDVATVTSIGGYSTNSYQQKFGTVNVRVGIGVEVVDLKAL